MGKTQRAHAKANYRRKREKRREERNNREKSTRLVPAHKQHPNISTPPFPFAILRHSTTQPFKVTSPLCPHLSPLPSPHPCQQSYSTQRPILTEDWGPLWSRQSRGWTADGGGGGGGGDGTRGETYALQPQRPADR
ncbi:hypothetical protein BC938DRAFT_473855 [Jimgerdemannia flammicorona]|uniref:Uncharacterized protein n=1 Tax=Jimgerdemannia flammicorona TaxID=994334 RepID=A0A433Q3G5_9FUNG|nr:hypothetical protein BC938DRAFT_473855 [Jimgerdemannia flammicorona]